MLIAAWIATIDVKGQSMCSNTVTFTPTQTYTATTYNINDSIYWLKFVATSSNVFLKIVQPNNTPVAAITHIYLYSGTCRSLNLRTIDFIQ